MRAGTNAELCPGDLERVARPDRDGGLLLSKAVDMLGLSARAYSKVLKVSRTLADLDAVDAVRSVHVAEALQSRVLDREPMASRGPADRRPLAEHH